MELVSAIDMVESFLGDKGAASDTYQAWRTIRAKLAAVKKPSPNSARDEIKPCSNVNCSEHKTGASDIDCSKFVNRNRGWCSGYRA